MMHSSTTHTTPIVAPAPAGSSAGRLFCYVFAASAVLFCLTVQHGPAWQDSGVFQWRVWIFDVKGWLGLALAHPMLIVLGKAFSLVPVGETATRINLLSAICAAAATANVALLVRRLAPGQTRAAWFAAGAFALAHTTWWLATIAESQAILVALFTLELNLLLSLIDRPALYKVALLGLASGLGFSTHNLALLALPAYGLTVIHLCACRRLPWAAVPLMIAAWGVGGSLILTLIVQQAGEVGLAAAVRSALFGQSWQGAVLGTAMKPIARGAGYIAYNFPNLALPLAVAGLWRLHQRAPRPLRWALYYLTAAYFAFAIRYNIADQFMFFLPFYAMTAVLAGVGLAAATEGGKRRTLLIAAMATLVIGPALYAAAPALCKAAGVALPGRKDTPYRDSDRYWLTPWKVNETSAADFARDALTPLRPGDTVIADGTTLAPLRWAQQVQGLAAGVRILHNNDASPQAVPPGSPRVFVVSPSRDYHPEWMEPLAAFDKSGDNLVLYHVRWRTREATTLP